MAEIDELRKFHTERRQRSVAVTCDKSPAPMLWLDSSILIDLAKIDNNENIEKGRALKLSRLRNAARKAVRAEKLICPEWDQSLEFEGKRLERQIRRIITDLSCGAHCVPYAGIEDQQIARGLKAYITLAESIHIPARVHFYGDPASRIRESTQTGLIVEVNMPKPAEWIAKAEFDKHHTQKDLEALRQRFRGKRKKFEEQFELERVGESDVMMGMMQDFTKGIAAGKYEFWSFMNVEGYLKYQGLWREMAGPGPELAGIYSFMRSPYCWELPIVDIACRLSADLMTGHASVNSGDSQDIYHLATAIPIAHYVVADKAMVQRCKRRGIDAKWNTKMFSARNLDDLCQELEGLIAPS